MTKKRTYGEGTVYEWKHAYSADTKFRARRRIVLVDGKKKEVYGYGRTARIAVQDREARIKVEMAKTPKPESMTVAQLMAKYLTHKSVRQCKQATIRNYAQNIRVHINPYIGEMEISKVTPEDVEDIQHQIIGAGKFRTAQQVLMVIKGAFEYARKLYKRKFTLENPATDIERIPVPQKDNPRDQPWTLEEMDAFLQHAKEVYENGYSLYYPLFYTAFAAGLRRGELLGIRWPEVLATKDATSGETRYGLRVITQRVFHTGMYYEDTPKTRASKRDVPITKGHYELLQRHKALIERRKAKCDWFEDNLVFPSFTGHAIKPNNLKRSFNTNSEAVGLRLIKFHTLRKTYATYVTKSLINQNKFPPKVLQQLLGHSRPDVAMNVYAKVIEKDYLDATFTPLLEEHEDSDENNDRDNEQDNEQENTF